MRELILKLLNQKLWNEKQEVMRLRWEQARLERLLAQKKREREESAG